MPASPQPASSSSPPRRRGLLRSASDHQARRNRVDAYSDDQVLDFSSTSITFSTPSPPPRAQGVRFSPSVQAKTIRSQEPPSGYLHSQEANSSFRPPHYPQVQQHRPLGRTARKKQVHKLLQERPPLSSNLADSTRSPSLSSISVSSSTTDDATTLSSSSERPMPLNSHYPYYTYRQTSKGRYNPGRRASIQ